MSVDPVRVKALFQEAIERADQAERRAFLDRELGADDELRERIEALLVAYDNPPTELNRPLALDLDATQTASARTSPAPSAPDITISYQRDTDSSLVNTVIAGRYKLRQEIGEGGMGTVFLAEQTQPVKRQVAIKLIKA